MTQSLIKAALQQLAVAADEVLVNQYDAEAHLDSETEEVFSDIAALQSALDNANELLSFFPADNAAPVVENYFPLSRASLGLSGSLFLDMTENDLPSWIEHSEGFLDAVINNRSLPVAPNRRFSSLSLEEINDDMLFHAARIELHMGKLIRDRLNSCLGLVTSLLSDANTDDDGDVFFCKEADALSRLKKLAAVLELHRGEMS